MNFRMKESNGKRQLIRGIVAVVVGIAIMAYPGLTLNMVISVLGALLIIEGLVGYFLWRKAMQGAETPGFILFPRGVGNIIFGMVLLLFPTFMAEAFVFLVGIIMLIAGLSQVLTQLTARKGSGFSLVYLLISLVALFAGVLLLAKPFESAATLLMFFGAIVIVYGAGEIFWAIRMRKLLARNKPEPSTIDAEFEEIS